ncbi:hypothetical protein KY333_05190 [Candidatus Woesearchaeota archaeon]|nr:hypothetical protein [Candidatus Woesearchaeota archaeon]
MLEKKPFVNYTLESEKSDRDRVLPVKINQEWESLLKDCKKVLNQPKDSTALKQLALIGSKVLLDTQTGFIIDTVFKNKQKNRRTGLHEIE